MYALFCSVYIQVGSNYPKTERKRHLTMEKNKDREENFLVKEWWLRAHLIIDHISGMTDDFALEEYQILSAIK